MAQTNLIDTGGIALVDSAATALAYARRDSSADISFHSLTATLSLISQGSLFAKVTAKSATFTADTASTIYVVDTSSTAVTANLPAASTATNQVYIFIATSSSHGIVLDGNVSETINGATTKTSSTAYACAIIWCDGSAWYGLFTGTWA